MGKKRGKEKKRARLFKRLFEIAESYLINIATEVEKVRGIIVKIVEG